MMTTTSLWICAVIVVVAVVSDIATRSIPNTATLGGLLTGIMIHTAVGVVDGGAWGGLRGAFFAIAGALACALLPFFAWRRGELGGGDVKLFAAIGALMGPAVGFDVQTFTLCISLVVLLPYRLLRHGAVRPTLANVRIATTNLFRKKGARVPYLDAPKLRPVILAPAIGVAFLLALFRHGAFG